MNGLLQYDFVWPYCWHLIHYMILFLFTRESSIFMILFCNVFMLYISLLFSAGSKSTKKKFSGSLVVFDLHLLCFGHCVLVQIVPVLYLQYLLSDEDN